MTPAPLIHRLGQVPPGETANRPPNVSRRGFLRFLGVTASVIAVPGLVAPRGLAIPVSDSSLQWSPQNWGQATRSPVATFCEMRFFAQVFGSPGSTATLIVGTVRHSIVIGESGLACFAVTNHSLPMEDQWNLPCSHPTKRSRPSRA